MEYNPAQRGRIGRKIPWIMIVCLAAYLGYQWITYPDVASLAAVIINPIRYSPVQPNKRTQNRIAIIETRMSKYSYYKN